MSSEVVHSSNTGIGQPLPRREDVRLVSGKGQYSDDFSFPNQVYAVVLRSPHAHARIRSIDSSAAKAMPGVLAVLTGRDMLADGLHPIPHTPFSTHPAEILLPNSDGSPTFVAPHYALPADKVRFVGEGVALVVAETIAIAKDAAEQIDVDYQELPSVTNTIAAAEPDAPRIWDEAASNVCIDSLVGDPVATEAAFACAHHVVSIKTHVQRVTGVPMEPRSATAYFDPETGRYTLYTGHGATVRVKQDLAGSLGIPADRVRVVMRDVGGNYGTRGGFYPDYTLVAWAAKRVGRPVKLTCDRGETFLTDYQGRDVYLEAELALDRTGRFIGMRGSALSNVGAHTVNFATLQKCVEVMTSIYDIPTASFRARAVLSNTVPTRPYRATGRPEAMFVIERLIDLAARDFGFDRIAIREQNLIPPSKLPYLNPFGMQYDNGLYVDSMRIALDTANWDGFETRRQESAARGMCRGIAVANYVDTGTGVVRERVEIAVNPDRTVDMVIGTMSNGQGHETSFPQLLTEWLGVPGDGVRLITGDTDIVQVGGGSHSGRSMRLASIIIKKATDEIVEKGRRISAHLLGARPEDIEFINGRFGTIDHAQSFDLFDLAKAAQENEGLPQPLRGSLQAICDDIVRDAAFPYGAHVCEVEVDPDTGMVRIVGYTAVDDVGRAINPLIVHGQTHGGIAQGVGQALWEHVHYDPETGQLYASSFMDYAMPRADLLPSFSTVITEVPASSHPLGVRPGGEGGTTPALAVVINAIVDALKDFGVRHVEMPATSERVWRAIQEARAVNACRVRRCRN
ncbi:MAG: xanthine dehydrogenase family protein molybdopterin-binding subunit [Bradyrhizobiaceae bacterium]|nr:xanthine dehydrogenase family protein molybdopterin-binding subunit [Bradyrhizobiaceae bacterium]